MDRIHVATTYLDALVSHDAESVLLAPDARRIDNGRVTVEGAEALRRIIRREPAAATSQFRWIVDADQAIAFYDLDADLARGSSDTLGPPDTWIPAYIGERFEVRNDRIEEIEVVYTAGPGRPRPERPARHPRGSDARKTVLDAAKRYVASLVSHEASTVPLADDVWRIENGRITGDGAADLRASLESDVMQSIEGVADERWHAERDTAIAFYTLRTRADGTLRSRDEGRD